MVEQRARKGKGEAIGKLLVFCTLAIIFGVILLSGNYRSPKKNRPRRQSTKTAEDYPERLVEQPSPKYFTKAYLSKAGLDKTKTRLLQKNLAALGYQVGKADGIIGKKTIAAAREFSNEFKVEPGEGFAGKLCDVATYNGIIAEAHPDWPSIFKNKQLARWINRQPADLAEKIESAMQSGDPNKAIKVLNCYKFDKEKPPPLPLPRNGIIKRHFSYGVAPLRIITRHLDRHHYVKLVEVTTGRDILTAFVRGGQTIEMDVPLGSYELRYATGTTWFGERFLFGPMTVCKKADKILNFAKKPTGYSGYSVELYLQRYGNLKTPKISPFDF